MIEVSRALSPGVVPGETDVMAEPFAAQNPGHPVVPRVVQQDELLAALAILMDLAG